MAENSGSKPSPERAMALAAIAPGAAIAVLAFALGAVVAGLGTGISAALGVGVAVGGFAAQVRARGRARTVSLGAVQGVALFGFLVLLGLVFGAYAALNAAASWFSPRAFGLGLLALLPVAAYEAYLTRRGRLAELIVDADRAATARAKEKA
jgi:MFS family permease